MAAVAQHSQQLFLQTVVPDFKSYIERTQTLLETCLNAAVDAEHSDDKSALEKLDQKFKDLIRSRHIAETQLKNIEALRTSAGLPEERAFRSQLKELEELTLTDADYARDKGYREFRSKIWAVKHPKEPMPALGDADAEEDDDIVISTQVETFICPLTQQRFVSPMQNPDCKHNYSEAAIRQYLKGKRTANCPQSGCRATVELSKLKLNKVLERQMLRNQATQPESKPEGDYEDLS